MKPASLKTLIRNAFCLKARCCDYATQQIEWFYENLPLLYDNDVKLVVPLLLVCEIDGYGIQGALRDLLIYFLDGARLKLQPDGSWWCNENAHKVEIGFLVETFDKFSPAQKYAVWRWLIDFARNAFKDICPQSVESAILFWESGCHPENFDFQDYTKVLQNGVGYMLMPKLAGSKRMHQ